MPVRQHLVAQHGGSLFEIHPGEKEMSVEAGVPLSSQGSLKHFPGEPRRLRKHEVLRFSQIQNKAFLLSTTVPVPSAGQ